MGAVASKLNPVRSRHASLAQEVQRLRLACVLLMCSAWLIAARAAADDCSNLPKRDCPTAVSAESSRGLALGTGMRAAAVSTSALAYSPAALSLGNLYHIEGNVDYMSGLRTTALGGAVVDSSTSKLGAGVGLRGFLSGNNGYGGLDGRLGIGLALSDAMSLGLGARYISLTQNGAKLARGFTMDTSLRITPVSGLQIDVGALNFIDINSPFVPVTLTAGAALAVMPSLSVGADLLTDMSSFAHPEFITGGGVEYLAGDSVPLRIGYSVDIARGVHAIGAGVGYTDQRVGLDLGLKQEIKGGHDTRIMGAIRYYVN
jgi:hypothetical protein